MTEYSKEKRFEHYFKNKKVTVMCIGLMGRQISDIIYMAENGADIIATDLKTEDELTVSLAKLRRYPNVKLTVGKHDDKDFMGRDFILQGPTVSLDNYYLNIAMSNNIPVHMSLSLLLDILKREKVDIFVIGVTGTKGKSTTTALISAIVAKAGRRYHLAGNIRGVANLPLLDVIQNGDVIVAEIDAWRLQGFHHIKMSPNVAVFTNFFSDHQNYYDNSMENYFYDKSAIFKYQTENDWLILSRDAKQAIDHYYQDSVKSQQHVTEFPSELNDVSLKLLGAHNKINISLAFKTGKVIGLEDDCIIEAIKEFAPINGRFQLICSKSGIHYYNDNGSTTPNSTLISLQTVKNLHPGSGIILIAGGVDRFYTWEGLCHFIAEDVSYLVLLSGTSSDKMLATLGETFDRSVVVSSMAAAVNTAREKASPNDVIIMSPAASFSRIIFANECERNDQFLECINPDGVPLAKPW